MQTIRCIIIPLLAVLSLITPAIAQKHGHTWVGGINEYPGVAANGVYAMRFSTEGIQFDTLPLQMNFEATVGALSDAEGQLLLVTNGCYIAYPDGDTLPGSAGLNPGWIHDRACPKNGYIAPRGAMFLPWPGQPDRYVLLHMGLSAGGNSSQRFGPFYYTDIEMSGGGVVNSKNNILLNGDLEPFAVVRHGNGRDWWIVVPERGTANYHRLLLSPAGFSTNVQTIGSALGCTRTGSSVFSNAGTRYARTHNCKTVVMDFDRCMGLFSRPIAMDRTPHIFGGGGVVFSPDDSEVWVGEQMAIMKADLTASNPVLDTMIGFFDILPLSLGQMQYGPDRNIYLSGNQRYPKLPRIELVSTGSPVFQINGVALPFQNVRTLPHMPNFALYDWPGSVCDSIGVNTPVSTDEVQDAPTRLLITPNPGSGLFTLSGLPAGCTAVRVYDLLGRERGVFAVNNQQIELSNLTTGTYIVVSQPTAGATGQIGRVVIAR
jgi:hypothetical protein